MKISGFTILRNAVRLDYPFRESMRSLLPLVDEFIVGVGDSDDGTWEAVQALGDRRITPFRSDWSSHADGELLSRQTNLGLARCAGDWAVYLQADEVLHEDDLDRLRRAMRRHLSTSVEGLLFRYHHFWTSYGLEADCHESFYPRAVRAVKLGLDIQSVGDAAGFARQRAGRARGLIKADAGAAVYHYGWCNPPAVQAARIANIEAVYRGAPAGAAPEQAFWPLPVRRFRGSHPAVMRARVAAAPEAAADHRLTTPAWLRAAWAVARRPAALRGWARPLLPVAMTNVWWRVSDYLDAHRRPRMAGTRP